MSDPASAQESTTTNTKIKLGAVFRRFWIGSLSSNLADGVMITALPMVAALLTNDPLLVSGLMVARFLPWLLIGLFAGVLVDRLDRGRIMVVTNTVRGGAIAFLAVVVATEQATIWWLYAVMFAVMFCEVCYDLAGRSMLPDTVPPGTLDRANGRLEGGKIVTENFAGAPLAGFLFAVTAALPLAANAGAYLLGALVLLGMPLAVRRPPRPQRAPTDGGSGGAVRSVFAEIRDGMRVVFGDRRFRSVVLLIAMMNVALMAQASILVLMVQDHFGVPAALYGVFLTSSAVGGLLGSLAVARIVRLLGRFRTQAICYTLLGMLSAAFALSPNAVGAGAAWCALSFAVAVANIVSRSVWPLVIPKPLLGRALSCITTVGIGMSPLGAVIGGLLGRVDLRLPSLAACAAIVVTVALTAPALRALAKRADATEAEAAESAAAAREGGAA